MTRKRPPSIAKRDANERDIFDTLRRFGLSVQPIDVPCDAIVGYGGQTWLVEIKTDKGTLTKPQRKFYETWKGNRQILRSTEGAQEFAKHVRQTATGSAPKTLAEVYVDLASEQFFEIELRGPVS